MKITRRNYKRNICHPFPAACLLRQSWRIVLGGQCQRYQEDVTKASPPCSTRLSKPMNPRPVNFPPTPVATGSRLHGLCKRLWIQNDLIVSKYVLSNLTLVTSVGKTLGDVKKTAEMVYLNRQQFTPLPPGDFILLSFVGGGGG